MFVCWATVSRQQMERTANEVWVGSRVGGALGYFWLCDVRDVCMWR